MKIPLLTGDALCAACGNAMVTHRTDIIDFTKSVYCVKSACPRYRVLYRFRLLEVDAEVIGKVHMSTPSP